MARDTETYLRWLAENAREGVIIENMILEWKLAERAKRAQELKPDTQAALKAS